MFGHQFRRAWYRWIAKFNAVPTMCVLQPAMTGGLALCCRIAKCTWCQFGARASLACKAWAHCRLCGYMTPLIERSWCYKPFPSFLA